MFSIVLSLGSCAAALGIGTRGDGWDVGCEWEMRSFVLQTLALLASHTGHNITEVLTSAISEWGIKTANGTAVVTATGNARNMIVVVRVAVPALFCPHAESGVSGRFKRKVE